jgi:hypothetical protein
MNEWVLQYFFSCRLPEADNIINLYRIYKYIHEIRINKYIHQIRINKYMQWRHVHACSRTAAK